MVFENSREIKKKKKIQIIDLKTGPISSCRLTIVFFFFVVVVILNIKLMRKNELFGFVKYESVRRLL